MITNKYAQDYRLENRVNAKGKTVTKTVYVGKYYTFDRTPEKMRAEKRILLIAAVCALAMLALGAGVYNNQGFSSQYYTLVPFLVCAFPLLYLGMALYSVFTFKGKCTREQKDHISERIPKCGFAGMVFSGAGVIGILISTGLKIAGVEERPVHANDIIFMTAAVLMFLAFLVVFLRRKAFLMKEINKPDVPAEPAEGDPQTPKN